MSSYGKGDNAPDPIGRLTYVRGQLKPWERDTHKLWQGQSACPKCGRTWIGEAPFLLWNCDDPFHRYGG